MSKNARQEVSAEADLEKVSDLIAQGQLDEAMSGLDPADVPGTLDRVPAELVRLVASLHLAEKLSDVVPYLSKEHANLVRELAAASKKRAGSAFVKALLEAMKADPDIRRRVGVESFVRSAWPITEVEAKTYNTITEINAVPQVMLNSARVYVDLSFLQRGDLLWRCKLEIDELLSVGSYLLTNASEILERLSQKEDIEARVRHDECRTALRRASKAAREAQRHLRELKKRSASNGQQEGKGAAKVRKAKRTKKANKAGRPKKRKKAKATKRRGAG